jgi:hypothetical protein
MVHVDPIRSNEISSESGHVIKSLSNGKISSKLFHEIYHDNCHDYLKKVFVDKYSSRRYQNLIEGIRDKIPLIEICALTPKDVYVDTVVCDQHAVIFSHHLDAYPVLATYALNACVGLIIYEPRFNIGSLAHIDGLPGYSIYSAMIDGLDIKFDPIKENVLTILHHLRRMKPLETTFEFDFYLVGGIFDLSEIMINDIIACLLSLNEPNHSFTFKGRNLLGPENQSRNICFDTRSGEFSYFDFMDNVEVYKNHLRDYLPMNIIKAPRKSEALLDVTYVPKLSVK